MALNKLLTGVLLASAAATSAFAADLPSRKFAPAAPVYTPAFSWTGFYAGLNAGASFNHGSTGVNAPANWFDIIDFGGGWKRSEDDVNFTGGAQLGYNYQMGSFVLGGEADFNYANIETKYSGFGVIPLGTNAASDNSFNAKSKVEWFGTARARLGFTPMERLLVFATAGLAYGNVKSSTTEAWTIYNNGVASGSEAWSGSKSGTRYGWTVGGGAEYAVTNNLSVKAEYLYVDLGDNTYWTRDVGGTPIVRISNDTKFSVVRAGVNYRF
jgi:outer membrane immunogenic protein